ncbi:hypothetical protein D3C84_954710 [compost metagenome]
MLGEPTEPAHRTISLRALKVFAWPCQRALTAEARPLSSSTRSTSTPVSTVRLGRWRMGLRKALDAFQRMPAF